MVLPRPARGAGTLIPSAQRLVWAAKQPLGGRHLRLPLRFGLRPQGPCSAWKIPWVEEPGRLQSTGSDTTEHQHWERDPQGLPQRRVVWMWFGAFPGAFGLGRAQPLRRGSSP